MRKNDMSDFDQWRLATQFLARINKGLNSRPESIILSTGANLFVRFGIQSIHGNDQVRDFPLPQQFFVRNLMKQCAVRIERAPSSPIPECCHELLAIRMQGRLAQPAQLDCARRMPADLGGDFFQKLAIHHADGAVHLVPVAVATSEITLIRELQSDPRGKRWQGKEIGHFELQPLAEFSGRADTPQFRQVMGDRLENLSRPARPVRAA